MLSTWLLSRWCKIKPFLVYQQCITNCIELDFISLALCVFVYIYVYHCMLFLDVMQCLYVDLLILCIYFLLWLINNIIWYLISYRQGLFWTKDVTILIENTICHITEIERKGFLIGRTLIRNKKSDNNQKNKILFFNWAYDMAKRVCPL